MTRTTLEQDTVDGYLGRLEQWFHIHREVAGRHHSGAKVRIDAVVSPRDAAPWKTQPVALGLEFKDLDYLRTNFDTRNYTRWLAQCMDYASTSFEGFGYCYVFACPGFLDDTPTIPSMLPGLLGQMGVGELVEDARYGLTFRLHGRHRIWSQQRGVEDGARWSMERKFGAR